MSHFFTPHARARAQERYGLKLTIAELSFIAHCCNGGSAAVVRTLPNGTKTYCVTVRGVNTFPVISQDQVIITFQPPDFMVASSAKKHRREMGRANKLKRHNGRQDSPRPYRRTSIASHTQEAMQ